MAASPRNERRPHLIPKSWKILRVAAKARPDDEAQLRLRIGELEEMIVGADEKDARRRAAGILPPESGQARAAMPMRYAEKQAMHQQRLKGWLGIAILGILLVLAGAWFFFRLLVVL